MIGHAWTSVTRGPPSLILTPYFPAEFALRKKKGGRKQTICFLFLSRSVFPFQFRDLCHERLRDSRLRYHHETEAKSILMEKWKETL